MSATSAEQAADAPSEEQIRRYEEELRRITSGQVVVQSLASLITIAGRKLGLAPGTEPERDLEQARDAIDAAKALLPIAERRIAAGESRQLRDALSQLQIGYARLAQSGEAAASGAEAAPPPAGVEPKAASGEPGHGDLGGGSPAGDEETQEGAGKGRESDSSAAPGDARKGPGPAQASGRLWVPGSR